MKNWLPATDNAIVYLRSVSFFDGYYLPISNVTYNTHKPNSSHNSKREKKGSKKFALLVRHQTKNIM